MRTEDVPPEHSIRRATGRKLDFVIIGVLALAVTVLLFDRFRWSRGGGATTNEKSIAVLPFENLTQEAGRTHSSLTVSRTTS